MTISQLIGFSTDSSIFHEMKNGEYPKNLEFSPFFSVPDVIRTRGLPLRRRTLYPAELQKRIKNRSFLPELNLCYSFVIFTWSMFEHSLRRRVLYPTELLRLISKIFNFSPSTDSNELPLRRRLFYPLN